MSKVLVIKGADFSHNAIVRINYSLVIEQGVIILINDYNSGMYSYQGDEPNWFKRMRVPSTELIYIEAGRKYTLTGLQGNGSVPFLRFDAAIYSSAVNPGHDTLLHTLNGDSSNYYKFNTAGDDSYTFTAPYTGYYAFCFAGPTLAEVVSPANYDIYIYLLQ